MNKNAKLGVILITFLFIFTNCQALNATDIKNNNSYGLIISVIPEHSHEMQRIISRLINDLLEENIRIYWTSNDTTILTDKITGNNEKTRLYQKGSFVIPFTKEPKIDDKIITIAYDYNSTKNVEIYSISESINLINSYKLNIPKIVYYSTHTVDCYSYFQHLYLGGFKHHTFLNDEEIIKGKLNDSYNVFVYGGDIGINSLTFLDFINPIKKKVYTKIREFVNKGGGYIGSCLGGYMASSGFYHPPVIQWDYG